MVAILSLKGRDYIDHAEFTKEEMDTIFNVAFDLKRQYAIGVPHPVLQGKTLFMLFYNKSLRTRNSFEAGMFNLGGHAHYLTPEAVYRPALAAEEEAFVTERVSDVARVLSEMGHGISIRIFGDPTGWVYGHGDEYIREFAHWASIPVINMEDDMYHPCQAAADIMTMMEFLGDLKGKKFVMSWAYSPSVKKPMAVPQSLVTAGAMYGMNVVLAHPKGFELDPKVVTKAKELAEIHGGSFEISNNMKEAFEDADVVYPKAWPSVENLPPITSKPKHEKTKKLADRNKTWICDAKMMELAKKTALYMHCLPCDRGFEVTDEVADGPHSVIYQQAGNRLHAQKGIMACIMR
ncbi:MAG: ornithine carbamoyltransferase [Thermodesulfobacteriota bacterium]